MVNKSQRSKQINDWVNMQSNGQPSKFWYSGQNSVIASTEYYRCMLANSSSWNDTTESH
ncbi:hypothetical protein Hanom_Chr10g00912181 [Helianthus anomalus]